MREATNEPETVGHVQNLDARLCVDQAAEGRLLGAEEFQEQVKHRIDEHHTARPLIDQIRIKDLLSAAAKSSGLTKAELCGKGKRRGVVAFREAVIMLGTFDSVRLTKWTSRKKAGPRFAQALRLS